MPELHEFAEGMYRIATYVPAAGITFNQFLIDDEAPLLFHTGQRFLFAETLAGVRRVLDPARLRYVSWSHFEADECGALNQFLEAAPGAEAVHSELGAMVNVNDFAIRTARIVHDGEVLELGRHQVRFLVTPQVPHAWDAILAFEESTGTLLASDLFTQREEQTPVTDSDMVERTIEGHRLFPGYMTITPRTARTYERLEALRPRALACMHGPAFVGDCVGALRDLRAGLEALEAETLNTSEGSDPNPTS
jgi:flavorubredoxin